MPTVLLSHVILHSNVSLICAWLEHRTFFLCLISCSHIRHIWPIIWVNIFICFALMHFGLLEFFSIWIETKPRRKIQRILITNSPPDLNKSKWTISVKMAWIFREVTGLCMHLQTVGYHFFYWHISREARPHTNFKESASFNVFKTPLPSAVFQSLLFGRFLLVSSFLFRNCQKGWSLCVTSFWWLYKQLEGKRLLQPHSNQTFIKRGSLSPPGFRSYIYA